MTSQPIDRRGFLGTASLVAACSRRTSDQKPNFVLVITDDHGCGDLGCHGNPVINTPKMDLFHANAVRFTEFHVAPMCASTRAGRMEGRYAFRSGVTAAFACRSIMQLEETTLAEMLKRNGSTTGLFGEWHLDDNFPFRPNECGFDETIVRWSADTAQAVDTRVNDYYDDRSSVNNILERYEGHCTDVFFRQGLEWIEQCHGRPIVVDDCYSKANESKASRRLWRDPTA